MSREDHTLSDEELMESIKNGRETAFDALYQRYAKKMLAYFYNMLGGDKDKAQDFSQELFIKILNKVDQFDSRQNFAAWIFTMASNMCKNEYRRLGVKRSYRDAHLNDQRIADTTETSLYRAEFYHSLILALERLDPERKELYILRFEEELSIEQIAVIMNLREGTVKSRLFYLKKELARLLRIFDPKMN